MTTIREMRLEIGLDTRERIDWANTLERAILMGHVKRPASDVSLMRSRHPTALAAVRAFAVLEAWRDRLPEDFITEIEREET